MLRRESYGVRKSRNTARREAKAAGKPKGLARAGCCLSFVCAGIAVFLTYAAVQSSRRAGLPVAVVQIERDKAPPVRQCAARAVGRAEARHAFARTGAVPAPSRSKPKAVCASFGRMAGKRPGASVIRVPDSTAPETNRQSPRRRPTRASPSAFRWAFLPKMVRGWSADHRATLRAALCCDIQAAHRGGAHRVWVSARSTTDAITRLP